MIGRPISFGSWQPFRGGEIDLRKGLKKVVAGERKEKLRQTNTPHSHAQEGAQNPNEEM